jgi:hypothetical protein
VTKNAIALLVLAVLAVPAAAYHHQTPPVVAYTLSGDTPLPRLAADGRRFAIAIGQQIFRLDRSRNLLEQLTTVGDNENPTISNTASVIAWDTDCSALGCPEPGRQIFMWSRGGAFQVTHDPTGTSRNAALNGHGKRLAFESRGDLAGNGNSSGQIFIRTVDGTITQVSHGSGNSGNAAFDRNGVHIVYDSTSDADGGDTGIAQIWLGSPTVLPIPVTNGLGPSRRPAISSDARVIAFESTADLIGDLHDTGVSNIFVYEIHTRTLTQITSDPEGCSGASVSLMPGDWRVAFTCHGQGFFHHVRASATYALPIAGGDTAQAVAELGGHFMMVSTTANLIGTGTTPGHQIYLLNLWKLMGF